MHLSSETYEKNKAQIRQEQVAKIDQKAYLIYIAAKLHRQTKHKQTGRDHKNI